MFTKANRYDIAFFNIAAGLCNFCINGNAAAGTRFIGNSPAFDNTGYFQLSSIISTTGFVTADFSRWPVASQMLLLIAMFIGSCAGSTAGGIKVIRMNMLFKLSRRNILTTGQPKKVNVIRIDKKAVDESIVSQVAQFAVMYVALVFIGSFLLTLEGK